jgi:hypothetical protein
MRFKGSWRRCPAIDQWQQAKPLIPLVKQRLVCDDGTRCSRRHRFVRS